MSKIFCINSLPRAGTHMVRDALNRHSMIRCYAEIFGPPSHRPSWVKGGEVKDAIRWMKGRKQPSVIGFCIHRRELRKAVTLDVEGAIPPNLLTIYIYRENSLHQYVSARRAKQTNVWTVMGRPSAIQRPVLDIASKDALRYFKWAKGLTKAHPKFRRMLRFSYEEIVADMEGTFTLMQQFLGLPVEPIKPQTRKLGTSMRKSIRNYDALKKHFRGTQWGRFFDE